MSTSDNMVFISYRRSVSSFIARAVFQDLRAHDYDVFMDVESLDSGAFTQVLLNQIAARPHFIVILSPGALEGCESPGDWVRREIETAIDLKRNIVPLLFNDFRFEDAEPLLTGKLNGLKTFNGLVVPHDYFDAAMDRLRSRFLKQQSPGQLIPAPVDEEEVVEHKILLALDQPDPTAQEVSAQDYYAQALRKMYSGDFESAAADFTEAILLKPDFAAAYLGLGNIHAADKNYAAAIEDYACALRLDPNLVQALDKRAKAYLETGDYQWAIDDYSQILDQYPTYSDAYTGRAHVYREMGDYDAALIDYTTALELDPEDDQALDGRASVYYHLGQYERCITDYAAGIKQSTNTYWRYNNRGEAYFALGQYEQAFSDFGTALKLNHDDEYAKAGLAVTLYRLGRMQEAHDIWRQLVSHERRFRDAIWVAQHLTWAPALVDTAQKLIASQ
jgi:tetratricopeptide (TPR) repeat protein